MKNSLNLIVIISLPLMLNGCGIFSSNKNITQPKVVGVNSKSTFRSLSSDYGNGSFDYNTIPSIVNKTDKDPSYGISLKNHERPARGCLPVEDIRIEEARSLMASQNITTDGATELEEKTLGVSIARIQQLNGGVLRTGVWDGNSPYPFRFRNGKGYSGQRWDHIVINRKGEKEYGLSVAQHVHEYAHFIGNRGGYGSYQSYMKGAGLCMVSNYADNSPGEQYAEVFTAFVTEPNILLSNKRTPNACKRAFNYFKEWFDHGDRVEECM